MLLSSSEPCKARLRATATTAALLSTMHRAHIAPAARCRAHTAYARHALATGLTSPRPQTARRIGRREAGLKMPQAERLMTKCLR